MKMLLSSKDYCCFERQDSSCCSDSIIISRTEVRTMSLWRKAIYVSLLSFVSCMMLCTAGLVLSSMRSSASTAAFAADCFLDALTSIIIFWRYLRAIKGRDSDEHLACIYLGILLIVSAFAITGKAIADVVISDPEIGNSQWLLWLSLSAAFVFTLTAGLKYWLYKLLLNESILMDAVNTFLSGMFCVAIVITVILVDYYPHLWFLDPLEGGVFGLFMGVYGIKCIIDNCDLCFKSEKEPLNVKNTQQILLPVRGRRPSRLPSKADFLLSSTIHNTCDSVTNYYSIP